MLSNCLILCGPFLFLFIFPSIKVFSNEPALCIRWRSIGASASASVLPMNIQGWFSLGLIGLIFLLSNNSVGNVKQILILKVEYFYFSKDVDVIFIALTCFGVTVYNFFLLIYLMVWSPHWIFSSKILTISIRF